MFEHWTEYSRFVTALLVIIDPFLAIPILLDATHSMSGSERARVVRNAALTVAIVLLLSAISGEALLTWMGTSLGSFRVGGGIVLLLMALAMLQARVDPMRARPEEVDGPNNTAGLSVAVVPLAIPLLAGPGAMSTVVIAMQRSTLPGHQPAILLCIVLVVVILWGLLSLAEPIGRRLDAVKLNILNRIFGLLLAAVAVEVMANGLKQLFPVLAASP